MRTIPACLCTAAAVLAGLGAGGKLAWAQDDNAPAGYPQVHMRAVDRMAGGIPDVSSGLFQGPVAMGLPPASAGPPPSWPCFAPNAPCTADPAGGLLVGTPLQIWPISGTTNCTQVPCGQIFSIYQTTTASGKVGISISIKQGTNTIFSFSKSNIGSVTANQIGIVDLTGIQFSTSTVAGNATISVTTTVGSAKITGKANIALQ